MQFIDQLNRVITLDSVPKRIISVVPSQSELLVDLGVESQIVGVTKFCIHTSDLRKKTAVIGGTKNLNIEKIKSLNPDLIIANKEENELLQIEELSKLFPVWISDIATLDDALIMINNVGEILEKSQIASKLIGEIKIEFENWKAHTARYLAQSQPKSAAYLIWNDPIMTIGQDTFIHDMLDRFGLKNVFSTGFQSRYPIISRDDLIKSAPDFLLLSSEPYPFKTEHIKAYQDMLPETKVLLVDGEMFSWYGSRLLKVPQYFGQLFQDINS